MKGGGADLPVREGPLWGGTANQALFWRSGHGCSGDRITGSGGRYRFFQNIQAKQAFNAVENLFARTAADQTCTQLQLVMGDPECRFAMRTLGCERHVSGLAAELSGQGDPAFVLGPDR